jgi:hypothetical protein
MVCMKIWDSLKELFAWLYGARGPAGAASPGSEVFPEKNTFVGKTIRSGAFEFLASAPIGEVRGRLADPEREPPDGAPVFIVIPSKCIRIDTTPPDENAWAGRVVSCAPAGDLFAVRFETDSGVALHILSAEAPPEVEADESLYAWAFPEDVVGIAD